MAGVNKVILVGNVGKDPEVKSIGSKKVAKFVLATSESYKDQSGERVEQTEWHNIEFWGTTVDVVEKYVKKGSQVYVEGKIRTRSYEDKDGVKRYVTEIMGNSLTLLGSKQVDYNQPANQTPAPATKKHQEAYAEASHDDDSLPF
jgi:single-strand DNA-binding protein